MSSQSFAIAVPPDLESTDLHPILLRADASCLVLDQRSSTLFIADAYSGELIRVDEAGATQHTNQRRIATIDSGGVLASNRIGGLALAPSGTLFASRVGYGQSGAIYRIEPGAQPVAFAKVSPRQWQGGMVFDADDDRLYTTQYLRSSHGAFEGAIVEVDPVTGEVSTVMDGFLHPVGITKLGRTLVVTDARQRAVFRVGMAGGRAVSRLQLATNIERPDSICACGGDSVLVTSYDDVRCRGSVRRIWLDGQVSVIAQGAWEPRGVTTDGPRVFVAMRRTGTVMAFQLSL
jgi:sugar lactone lactonase YvrE